MTDFPSASPAAAPTCSPDRVVVFDTTLRDGEQCPGATLYPSEKVRIARQLDKLGVDCIEAGFPASSQADADAVRMVAEAVHASVAALARCVPGDIAAAADALAGLPPARALLHVFIGTSRFQREGKLHLSKEALLARISESVALAKSRCPRVLFSAEDAFRTEPDFLCDVVRAALAAGATEICLPDTVGIAMPVDFAKRLSAIRAEVPALEDVPLHTHCHNDLGMALANSLAALDAGASVVHCTVNGIGERAGNCPLEELALALHLRPDAHPFRTDIRLEELYPTSRLVAQLTSMPVQSHKPVVGANAFAHESGIHQDGLLKDQRTYEIVSPAVVGRPSSRAELVLGRHSGRAGFVDHIVRLGINLPPDRLQKLYVAFQALAEKKRIVYDDDLLELLREHLSDVPPVYVLRSLAVSAGTRETPSATVELERDGIVQSATSTGTGPIDAAFRAIDRVSGVTGELKSFSINALTRGQDALGEVALSVCFGTRTIAAKGSDTDVVTAAAKAYLNALNRFLA